MKPHGNRHTIRLRGYDYSQDGWHFITVCVSEFKEVFGEIEENIFYPSEWGNIVEKNLKETVEIREGKMSVEVFQVMPNHIHFIVVIGSLENLPVIDGFPDTSSELAKYGSPIKAVGSMVRGLKGRITSQIQIKEGVVDLKLWQRNYYERIVRDEKELNRIRYYIRQNPMKWQKDKQFFKKLLEKMIKR
jgi:putative transposase